MYADLKNCKILKLSCNANNFYYDNFTLHKIKNMDPNNKKEQDENLERMNYPENEDIFNQEAHVTLDGDGIPETDSVSNDEITDGLDIPGSEMDDQQQIIGSEDEENNYWSLGGDNHENLETPEDIN